MLLLWNKNKNQYWGGSNLLKIIPMPEKESTSKKMSAFKEILRYIWEKTTMGKGSRKEI